MSLESVRAWLPAHAPDLPLIEVAESTATVAAAALALGVEPGRIAKTLAVRVGDALSCWSRAATPGSTMPRPRRRSARGRACSAPRRRWRSPVIRSAAYARSVWRLRSRSIRRLAQGLRHRLSGRRLAQQLGAGVARAAGPDHVRSMGRSLPSAGVMAVATAPTWPTNDNSLQRRILGSAEKMGAKRRLPPRPSPA